MQLERRRRALECAVQLERRWAVSAFSAVLLSAGCDFAEDVFEVCVYVSAQRCGFNAYVFLLFSSCLALRVIFIRTNRTLLPTSSVCTCRRAAL